MYSIYMIRFTNYVYLSIYQFTTLCYYIFHKGQGDNKEIEKKNSFVGNLYLHCGIKPFCVYKRRNLQNNCNKLFDAFQNNNKKKQLQHVN